MWQNNLIFFQREMTLILLSEVDVIKLCTFIFLHGVICIFKPFFPVICSLPFTAQVANKGQSGFGAPLLACPFWLWVTNNAEFTWGSSFSSVSQTDHFNQSYKLNTRTYSPPSTVSQGFKQRWWHRAGTSRVPWEITWQGGSLAFAGQEVYCLPLKKENSQWFADTL